MLSFKDAFNAGNDAFANSASEAFTLVRNGIPGQYQANSIDDLESALAGRTGGRMNDNTVNVWIYKTVVEDAQIIDGSVLLVRGKRVRVVSVNDGGHNTIMLGCKNDGAGFK